MSISPQAFLLFYMIFLVVAIVERSVSTFASKGTKPTEAIYHKWSFQVLFYSYLFIVTASIFEYFKNPRQISLIASFIGLFVYMGGVYLRRKAINELSDNWSIFTEIKINHNLITSGIYNKLRHPYYLAVALELVGACLIPNSFLSLGLVFLIQIPFLLIRIQQEEKVLIQCFGDSYQKYKKRTLI